MRARYRNLSGGLTPEENARLSRFEEAEGLWLSDRPTLATDYQRCLQQHAKLNCAWTRIVNGEPVRLVSVPKMDPEARLR